MLSFIFLLHFVLACRLTHCLVKGGSGDRGRLFCPSWVDGYTYLTPQGCPKWTGGGGYMSYFAAPLILKQRLGSSPSRERVKTFLVLPRKCS